MSRQNEGSGIGLSIVKSLVEIQDGTVSCKSKLNEGTEFLGNLPIINEDHNISSNMGKHILYKKIAMK